MNQKSTEETLQTIVLEIDVIKSAIERLEPLRTHYPALDRNLVRVSASIKMLEINFVDPAKV